MIYGLYVLGCMNINQPYMPVYRHLTKIPSLYLIGDTKIKKISSEWICNL